MKFGWEAEFPLGNSSFFQRWDIWECWDFLLQPPTLLPGGSQFSIPTFPPSESSSSLKSVLFPDGFAAPLLLLQLVLGLRRRILSPGIPPLDQVGKTLRAQGLRRNFHAWPHPGFLPVFGSVGIFPGNKGRAFPLPGKGGIWEFSQGMIWLGFTAGAVLPSGVRRNHRIPQESWNCSCWKNPQFNSPSP